MASSSLLPCIACALLALLQTGPAAPSMDEVKTRLQVYERRTASGRPDAEALAAVARMVVARALDSRRFDVWSQACLSGLAPETAQCQPRLLGALRQAAAPLADRSAAGAALARRGDKGATAEYFALVKDLPAKDLATIAPDLRALPEAQATPLLLRLLESPDSAHQIAACKVLGAIDTAQVRQALQAAVEKAAPGQDAWRNCMVARARLREPDSMLMISGYSRDMRQADLLDAATVMLEVGNEQGDYLLRKLTREAPGIVRLRAAEQITKTDAAYAARFVEGGLEDPDARVRAEALVLEKLLDREPSAKVRAGLVEADELVQLRAAEAILAWAARHPSR